LFDEKNKNKNNSIVVEKDEDKNKEQEWIEVLMHYHFVLNEKKQVFELSLEEDIVSFLETGLKKLTECYEVYVSKDLKDIKIVPFKRIIIF